MKFISSTLFCLLLHLYPKWSVLNFSTLAFETSGLDVCFNQAAAKNESNLQAHVGFIPTEPTKNGALVQAMVDRAPR